MPGMTGILARVPGEDHGHALPAMVECMMHEASYASGTYVDASLGLWAGWTAHAGSFADCMPVWNADRDVCLIFTGQDFTDRARTDPPRSGGARGDSQDARYLVHLYEERGSAFVESLNGWFSGLVADLRERRVVLFNDRYGLKRLYYHETPRALYFASEAKSLLKVLPEVRRLDPRSLGEFFSLGCVLQDRSLFSGVSLLPGGSLWTGAPGTPIRKTAYFRKESWEGQPRLSREEHYQALRATFARALPRYAPGDERITLALTGGLDSRMILAWAGHPAGSLPCHTFGGRYRDSADVTVARRVAQICGQPHAVIRLHRDFLSEFPALAESTVYISDGAMDVSGGADLYANRRVREVGSIRLTGIFGSEVLRGSIAVKPVATPAGIFEGEFARTLDAAAATYASERRGHRLSFIAFKQAPWHHFARLSVEDSQLPIRSPYLDNELVALAYRAPDGAAGEVAPSLRLIADGNPALTAVETDRAVGWGRPSLASATRRARQELTFRAEYAYDYGMPSWLARADGVLRSLHPERLFLGRHKFSHFRIWYRDELAPWVRDVLLDRRTLARPYLRGPRVEDIVRSHTAGRRNFTLAIHRLLTVELLQRLLIEDARTRA